MYAEFIKTNQMYIYSTNNRGWPTCWPVLQIAVQNKHWFEDLRGLELERGQIGRKCIEAPGASRPGCWADWTVRRLNRRFNHEHNLRKPIVTSLIKCVTQSKDVSQPPLQLSHDLTIIKANIPKTYFPFVSLITKCECVCSVALKSGKCKNAKMPRVWSKNSSCAYPHFECGIELEAQKNHQHASCSFTFD